MFRVCLKELIKFTKILGCCFILLLLSNPNYIG